MDIAYFSFCVKSNLASYIGFCMTVLQNGATCLPFPCCASLWSLVCLRAGYEYMCACDLCCFFFFSINL